MSHGTRESNERKLNFWKHVSKNILSFDHEVFVKSDDFKAEQSNLHSTTHLSVCSTEDSYPLYKDQLLKLNPASKLNYIKLEDAETNQSCSKCSSKLCDVKKSLKPEPFICENCKSYSNYKNQALFDKFQLKPLSVVLSDFKINKTELETKNSFGASNNLMSLIKIQNEQKKSTFKEHEHCANFKPSDGFVNSLFKEDFFSSNEHTSTLAEVQLLTSKISLQKPVIKLHRVEDTVAFCHNLNLQPVWKNNKLSCRKCVVKLHKLPKFRNKKQWTLKVRNKLHKMC